MLYRSNDNLLQNAIEFIASSSEIKIFSPYIRTEKLKEIIGQTHCPFIVVRWGFEDILSNATDFEDLYTFCTERGIQLYRNTSIHLKAILNERYQVFFGSANITNRGMSRDSNGNLELNGTIDNLSLMDRQYFDSILLSSQLVTDDLYNDLKEIVTKLREEYIKPMVSPEPILADSGSYFLLSALPMSISPDSLYHIYSNSTNVFSEGDLACASHDLANFKISTSSLNKEDFMICLGNSFNEHPFIKKLKKQIANNGNARMGYTELCIWLAENTTTVPTPRRWNIKDSGHIQILHNWIPYFDDYFYSDKRYPKGSDTIYYCTNVKTKLEAIVGSLKRDSARGYPAPHQIILLAAMAKNFKDSGNKVLDFDVLKVYFNEVWERNSIKFRSSNQVIHMPLKALTRKNLIHLTKASTSSINIEDVRTDAQMKIYLDEFKLSTTLIRLFTDLPDSMIIETYI